MAVSREASDRDKRKPRPPLDGRGLEALALRYVERYATTRSKLSQYLRRKLIEHGWAGDEAPDPATLAERFVALGYVDDRAFAEARGAALSRRGFGRRRVTSALQAAGVDGDDRAPAEQAAGDAALAAALTLARRRRIGPFAAESADRAGRERAIAMLIRAGHDLALARRVVLAAPGEVLEEEGAAQ